MKRILLFLLLVTVYLFSTVKEADAKNISQKDTNGTFEINFYEKRNYFASRKLYNWIIKDLNVTHTEAINKLGLYPNLVSAYYIDLNNDKKNEIIGISFSSFYQSVEGYQVFILEKHNNIYRNISSMNFEPKDKFIINNKFINNHKTITFVSLDMQEELQGNKVIKLGRMG